MTEYASLREERRGVAANRYLQVVVAFCKYQLQKETKRQNEVLSEGKKCRELHEEIGEMLPVYEILLAPKVVSVKEGAAALRTAAQVLAPASSVSVDKLKENAQRMY